MYFSSSGFEKYIRMRYYGVMYTKRAIEPLLLKALKSFPSLLLTGCRQAGKTTLLKHLLPDYRFVSLDSFSDLEVLQKDIPFFFANHPPPLILDEIQYAPEILRHIKVNIDKNREKKGQYILTGSQVFPLMKGVSESLAGRVALFEVFPLSWAEITRSAPDDATTLKRMVTGFYPEIVLTSIEASLWIDSYFMTYISRDVRLIRQAIQLSQFQRFLRLLAARVGQLINFSELAKEMGVSQPTIKEWVEILEATYIIRLLRPYFSNRTKRFVKSPKIYFVDTGLLCFLLGLSLPDQLLNSPFIGHVFENMVIMEAVKNAALSSPRPELYFYRSVGGVEVDLIIDRGSSQELYEIKWTKDPNSRHIESLKKVAAEMQPKKAALLSLTDSPFQTKEGIWVDHWYNLSV